MYNFIVSLRYNHGCSFIECFDEQFTQFISDNRKRITKMVKRQQKKTQAIIITEKKIIVKRKYRLLICHGLLFN